MKDAFSIFIVQRQIYKEFFEEMWGMQEYIVLLRSMPSSGLEERA